MRRLQHHGWIWAIGLVLVLLMATLGGLYLFRTHPDQKSPALPTASSLKNPTSWESFGGDWLPGSSEIKNRSLERGAKLMIRHGAWSDHQVEADVQIAEPGGEAGLLIRSAGEEEGVDAYHGYYAGLRTMDSSVELGRADFGWHSLIHKRLSSSGDLAGPIHLRLVIVGCNLAVAVTMSDGHSTAATTQDSYCIKTGRFGLRSSLTGATWKHLRVAPAGMEDILAIEKIATANPASDLAAGEPYDSADEHRYEQSLLSEAKKHQLRPGVQPIVNFLMSPGSHPNVAIQGEVISMPPLMIIQDDSGALVMPDIDPRTTIKVGDVVEAEGTVISTRFRSELHHAKLQVLWSDTEIPPLAVTAPQLTGGTYRGRSIEVEGILRSAKVRADGYDLVLQDAGQMFRALGSRDFQFNPAALQIGSRLRLRGVATSMPQFTDGIYSFTVITNRVEVVSAAPWWSPRHIVWLIVTCAGILLLAQFALHQLQRWRMRSILKEREQLAFEMHDTLAQSFTGIAYQLHAASAEPRGEAMVKTHVQHALEMVNISHREASRTIAALRPQYRDAAGILSGLKESAERLSDGGGLCITTKFTGDSLDLPLEVTDTLFRIGQEAISNAIQHSGTEDLILSLHLSQQQARLTVTDHGRGFALNEVEHGLGLESMRKRAAKVKAHFDVQSAHAQGTSIVVAVPLTLARGWFYRVRARLLGTSPHVL